MRSDADAVEGLRPSVPSTLAPGADAVAQALLRDPTLRSLPPPALASAAGASIADTVEGVASLVVFARAHRRLGDHLKTQPETARRVLLGGLSLDAALERLASEAAPPVRSPNVAGDIVSRSERHEARALDWMPMLQHDHIIFGRPLSGGPTNFTGTAGLYSHDVYGDGADYILDAAGLHNRQMDEAGATDSGGGGATDGGGTVYVDGGGAGPGFGPPTPAPLPPAPGPAPQPAPSPVSAAMASPVLIMAAAGAAIYFILRKKGRGRR